MSETPDIEAVVAYLRDLQKRILAALREVEATAFTRTPWQHRESGGGESFWLEDAPVLERACVNFSQVSIAKLPDSGLLDGALAGNPFTATGVSVIIHPRNPMAPTSHMNTRFFLAQTSPPTWWFGGGFDLTPYYGFKEDCTHWHRTAAAACEPFGADLYADFKRQCDEYFYLPHRGEARGIGGVFYDRHTQGGFARAFELAQALGDAYLAAYLPILKRRVDMPYTEPQRDFQLYRRGRYAEFNLLYDRGTRFGLQSGGRVECILGSLPPLTAWKSAWQPEPDSREARFAAEFLTPRDWTGE